MRKISIKILNQIKKKPLKTKELAKQLQKSQSWISNVVSDLAKENLIEKNRKVKLANTYEATILAEIMNTYKLEKILAGKREEILKELLKNTKTAKELESNKFPKSTVYKILKDLKTMGVIEKRKKRYKITNETLKEFLKTRKTTTKNKHKTNGEHILILKNTNEKKGLLTAFSAFDRYGVDYYPTKNYLYKGKKKLEREDVLIHAVLCAENKKQMTMCGLFYLKNKNDLETNKLWELSEKWDCTEKLADLLAYLDRRGMKKDLFLPWGEFETLLDEYGVNLRGEHPKENLLTSLEKVGERLDAEVDAFLLGGANLIFRGLKDTTKDVDVLFGNKTDFDVMTNTLKKLGYEEKVEVERAYEQLEPGTILEGKESPRWDLFVKNVASTLRLTKEMRKRSEKFERAGKLHIYLLSLTDMFLFKAVTNRVGDLEDANLIVRTGEIDWNALLKEIDRQEKITGKYLSFPVLDTLDLLSERHDIEVPIHNKLESHCLEKALIIALKEPKTIKALREELDFPEHQIYNKLRKLEEENQIEVDRSGKLNKYRAKKS